MSHTTILLIIFLLALFTLLLYTIKNRPDYLVLFGIRGLLSSFLIQFINYLCTLWQLPLLLLANPITLCTGGLLGFPGLLLLYALRLYFSSF
jgi:inhibitor of the pro-sigma K processing machinery